MQRINPPPIIRLLFVADLLLAGLHLAYFLLGAPFDPLNRIVNLDSETSVATWYASTKHLLTALVGLPVSYYLFKEASPRAWLFGLLVLAFLFFSLDEIAVLHETLGSFSDNLLPGDSRQASFYSQTGIWIFVLGLPASLVLFGLITLLGQTLQKVRGVRSKLAFGVALFLFGALGVELLSNFSADGTLLRHIEVFFEELFELLGSSFILWAFYDLLLGLGFVWRIGRASEAFKD